MFKQQCWEENVSNVTHSARANDGLSCEVAWFDGSHHSNCQTPVLLVVGKTAYENILRPQGQVATDHSRREHGGVVGNDGAYYEALAGPIATGASQYPEIDLGPAAQKAASNGAGVAVYVHSHVNFELKADGTTMQGTNVPSPADRSMLIPNKSQPYGMMLYPRFPWPSSNMVFFGANKVNSNGTKTDVKTTLQTVHAIVSGGGK